MKDEKLAKFDEEKRIINEKKRVNEEETNKMVDLIAEEDKLGKKRAQEEMADEEDQDRIRKEKMGMDDAAR